LRKVLVLVLGLVGKGRMIGSHCGRPDSCRIDIHAVRCCLLRYDGSSEESGKNTLFQEYSKNGSLFRSVQLENPPRRMEGMKMEMSLVDAEIPTKLIYTAPALHTNHVDRGKHVVPSRQWRCPQLALLALLPGPMHIHNVKYTAANVLVPINRLAPIVLIMSNAWR
jgi:hypothetical protein